MAEEIQNISPGELEEMLRNNEDVSIIDVREDDEVEAGKIPQAIHIRLRDIPEHYKELDRSKDYVMVCRSGHRSGLAAEFLQEKGFHVKNMEGGMLQWHGDVE
ncbi:rhodanese-like domain-containing protein [Sporolactobacillus sp. THM7-4]|nr:rhodanese-like domain-containing protein [Sporolactobacillus sp. THM7-4]